MANRKKLASTQMAMQRLSQKVSRKIL
jgi:hypothetical protein